MERHELKTAGEKGQKLLIDMTVLITLILNMMRHFLVIPRTTQVVLTMCLLGGARILIFPR